MTVSGNLGIWKIETRSRIQMLELVKGKTLIVKKWKIEMYYQLKGEHWGKTVYDYGARVT